jgi:hypothetical protein
MRTTGAQTARRSAKRASNQRQTTTLRRSVHIFQAAEFELWQCVLYVEDRLTELLEHPDSHVRDRASEVLDDVRSTLAQPAITKARGISMPTALRRQHLRAPTALKLDDSGSGGSP